VQEAQADATLLLLGDDHPTNRLVMLRQAASLGYAAEAVNDGEQALHAWRSGRYAAVVTDCNMPRMNGYELAAAIRACEAGEGRARTPIIACTANALPSAADFCIDSGMDDCIVKPAGLAEVGRVLDKWLPVGRGGPGLPVAPLSPAAPAPASTAPPGLVDLGLLSTICSGNPVAQADLLVEFRRVNEADATAVRAAAAQADYPTLLSFTHRIRGSSLMLGARLLAAACVQLDAAVEARDAGLMAEALGNFETELLRLHRHLAHHEPA
jgi:CheY-like chemotaxis protein